MADGTDVSSNISSDVKISLHPSYTMLSQSAPEVRNNNCPQISGDYLSLLVETMISAGLVAANCVSLTQNNRDLAFGTGITTLFMGVYLVTSGYLPRRSNPNIIRICMGVLLGVEGFIGSGVWCFKNTCTKSNYNRAAS